MKHIIQHPIALALADAGIEFIVHKAGIRIEGFSKSGSAELRRHPKDEDRVQAHMRYDETEEIEGLDDIIQLAWSWWQRYEDRGYECPPNFRPFFIEKGWIREETTVTTKVVKTR